ncbi:MAG: ATP-binding protein [Myxococcales bacterium]|nr:ATP-binding protein [Myxococcales bacterium]
MRRATERCYTRHKAARIPIDDISALEGGGLQLTTKEVNELADSSQADNTFDLSNLAVYTVDKNEVSLDECCNLLGIATNRRTQAILVRLGKFLIQSGWRRSTRWDPVRRKTDRCYKRAIASPTSPEYTSVGPEVLAELLASRLIVDDVHRYWPARCSLRVGGQELVADLHVRVIGDTGRNPLERRFQNPVADGVISPTPGRPCLLLGVWVEQGMRRAVIVAFDAYRRVDRTTRFSLFMPLSLLEEAADIGFVSHVSGSGETIYAFRPESIARYLDAFSHDASWGHLDPGVWARPKLPSASATLRTLAPPQSTALVEIRPKAGMFAAFARLNYKPWFALAEFVDNAVQSFLDHRERFVAAGSTGPLIVDVNLDEDEISVTDRAAGIRLEDFPRAFSPATPPSDASGLSEFGLGMKAAACWFAKEWSVRTSPIDEAVERTISFDVPKITREGLDHLPIQTRESRADDHFTVVTMRDLRVRPRGSTLAKVKEHLASIYAS